MPWLLVLLYVELTKLFNEIIGSDSGLGGHDIALRPIRRNKGHVTGYGRQPAISRQSSGRRSVALAISGGASPAFHVALVGCSFLLASVTV